MQLNESLGSSHNKFVFRLYIAGEAPNSVMAIRNLTALCKKYCDDNYVINIIDVLLFPESAWQEGIIATPTVRKIAPGNSVDIIGNLSNADQVINTFALDSN